MHKGSGMKMLGMLSTVALTLTLTTGSFVHADTGAPGTVEPLNTPAPEGSPKSEDTAFALSLGGTAASATMTLVGMSSNSPGLAIAGLASSLVTPSLGQWYAGKPVTAGMGIRAASGIAFLVGVGEAFKCLDVEDDCQPAASAAPLILGGLAGYGIGTIYDIATAKAAARDYNAKHRFAMSVAPTPIRGANGQSTMGVGIAGSF